MWLPSVAVGKGHGDLYGYSGICLRIPGGGKGNVCVHDAVHIGPQPLRVVCEEVCTDVLSLAFSARGGVVFSAEASNRRPDIKKSQRWWSIFDVMRKSIQPCFRWNPGVLFKAKAISHGNSSSGLG